MGGGGGGGGGETLTFNWKTSMEDCVEDDDDVEDHETSKMSMKDTW